MKVVAVRGSVSVCNEGPCRRVLRNAPPCRAACTASLVVTPAGAERRAGVHPPPFPPCGRIGGWAPAQGRGDKGGPGRRRGVRSGGLGLSSPWLSSPEERECQTETRPSRRSCLSSTFGLVAAFIRHPRLRATPLLPPLSSPRPERSGEPGSILRRFGPAEGSEAGPRLRAGATGERAGVTAGPGRRRGVRGGGQGLSGPWLPRPEKRECQTETRPGPKRRPVRRGFPRCGSPRSIWPCARSGRRRRP